MEKICKIGGKELCISLKTIVATNLIRNIFLPSIAKLKTGHRGSDCDHETLFNREEKATRRLMEY